MDWIHCNQCFVQPGEVKDKKFLLTNCGHMYCDFCINQTKRNNTTFCLLCEKPCSIRSLTHDMQGDVRDYFCQMQDIVQKTLTIMTFQDMHRQRLLQYKRNLIRKTEAAHQQLKNMLAFADKLRKKEAQLGKENASLKRHISQPPSTPSAFSFSPNILGATTPSNSVIFKTPSTVFSQKAPSTSNSQGAFSKYRGVPNVSGNWDNSTPPQYVNLEQQSPAKSLSSSFGRAQSRISTPEYVTQIKNISFDGTGSFRK